MPFLKEIIINEDTKIKLHFSDFAILNDETNMKNELLYSWAKRYPNQWTLITVKVDDRKKHITIDRGEMTHYYPYKRYILGNYPLDCEQFFELLMWFPRTPKKSMIKRVNMNPNIGDDLKLWLMLDSKDWLERN